MAYLAMVNREATNHSFQANSLAKSVMGNRMRSQGTGEGGLWNRGIAESEN